MHHRCLQVVYVNAVAHDVVGEIIGLAVNHARADAAACHPGAETARVMVSAVAGGRQFSLAIHTAAELTGPDNQGVVE